MQFIVAPTEPGRSSIPRQVAWRRIHRLAVLQQAPSGDVVIHSKGHPQRQVRLAPAEVGELVSLNDLQFDIGIDGAKVRQRSRQE